MKPRQRRAVATARLSRLLGVLLGQELRDRTTVVDALRSYHLLKKQLMIVVHLRRRGAFIGASPPLHGNCLPGKTCRSTPELDGSGEKVGGSDRFQKSGATATALSKSGKPQSKKKDPIGVLKVVLWWT
jgi:hypothetical protein